MQQQRCHITGSLALKSLVSPLSVHYFSTPKFNFWQMAPKSSILVILGSQRAAVSLAKAAHLLEAQPNNNRAKIFKHKHASKLDLSTPANHPTRVIEQYSDPTSSSCQAETLSNIEESVKTQMRNMKAEAPIRAVVFVDSDNAGEPVAFPFEPGSSFLGLEGAELLRKLVVVHSPELNFNNWLGVHMIPLDKTTEAPKEVLERALITASLKQDPAQIKDAYEFGGAATGRHSRRAVILLLGLTGHGKSKTINRLVGQDLFPMGKSTLGSTTKVIQRMTLSSFNETSAASISVAFDDTPGLEDTTYNDREANRALLYEYRKQQFPSGIYPNVILLVAAWDSITVDAHNEPHNFTSAVGKSMYNLKLSGLVDLQRPNVVVVVTKSLPTSRHSDTRSAKERDIQWNIQANRRIGIITDIQRRVFPDLHIPWEVVFIENGGGTNMSAASPTLPNGRVSHQNLFDAIRHVIERPSRNGAHDLAGYEALAMLTGAHPTKTKIDILVSKSTAGLEIPPSPPPPSERLSELIDQYFGVTYNPVHNVFGRTNVLAVKMSDVHSERIAVDYDALADLIPASQLPDIGGKDVVRSALRKYYSTSSAFQTASSTSSDTHVRTCITYQLTSNSAPTVSDEMKTVIRQLPVWSPESQEEYNEFFETYGSHVVTRVALGGLLRVVLRRTDAESPGEMHRLQAVEIFRDGGGAVAGDVTLALEAHFLGQDASGDYRATLIRWMRALETDPVFCPDDKLTHIVPLYELRGIGDKRGDLERAMSVYLEGPKAAGIAPREENVAFLQRTQRWENVQKGFKKALRAVIFTIRKGPIASNGQP
ncbi:MAC/Perforin domain-containing protein [Mycena sanguinolenta]|uniref:MAC/Perforin domain-containing protein n=1 Tax=Mycena sanguinolenta TaxID=230812 RepID=A0A8H7CMZ6_9AGAR|nr:MAC/Perforin domain-containing protein [Mycena sanguinolenta]